MTNSQNEALYSNRTSRFTILVLWLCRNVPLWLRRFPEIQGHEERRRGPGPATLLQTSIYGRQSNRVLVKQPSCEHQTISGSGYT